MLGLLQSPLLVQQRRDGDFGVVFTLLDRESGIADEVARGLGAPKRAT